MNFSLSEEEVEDPAGGEVISEKNRQRYFARFNIYKYDAELAIAFQTDCDQILDEFKKLDTFSFVEFSKLWKKFNFTLIFEGHQYVTMLETFIGNCFVIAKKFLFSSDIHVQVGAVYLLYALYYKQPIKSWIKIRLTQMETAKLLEIVEAQKIDNYLELVYVYNKLRLDGAFIYVVTPLTMGAHEQFTRRYDLTSHEIFSKIKAESSLEEFKKVVEKDSCFKELEEVDNEYQALMKKYSEKCAQLVPSVSSQIGTHIKRTYDMICGKESESEEEVPTKNRIKNIKMKAMEAKNATYRGSKETVSGVDYEDFLNKINSSAT